MSDKLRTVKGTDSVVPAARASLARATVVSWYGCCSVLQDSVLLPTRVWRLLLGIST